MLSIDNRNLFALIIVVCVLMVTQYRALEVRAEEEVEPAVELFFVRLESALNDHDANAIVKLQTPQHVNAQCVEWWGSGDNQIVSIRVDSVSKVSEDRWVVVCGVMVGDAGGRYEFDLIRHDGELLLSRMSPHMPEREAGKDKMIAVLAAIESRDEASVRRLISGEWSVGDGPEFYRWLQSMMSAPGRSFRAELVQINIGREYPVYTVRLFQPSAAASSCRFSFQNGHLVFYSRPVVIYDLAQQVVEPGFWEAVCQGDSVVEGVYLQQGRQFEVTRSIVGDREARVVNVTHRSAYQVKDKLLCLVTIPADANGWSIHARGLCAELLNSEDRQALIRMIQVMSTHRGVTAEIVQELTDLLYDDATDKIGRSGLLYALQSQEIDLDDRAERSLQSALLSEEVRFQHRVDLVIALASSNTQSGRRMVAALMNDNLLRSVILDHYRNTSPESYRETVFSTLDQPELRASGVSAVARDWLHDEELVAAALSAYDLDEYDANMLIPFMAKYPEQTAGYVHAALTGADDSSKIRLMLGIEHDDHIRLTEKNLQAVRSIMNSITLPDADVYHYYVRLTACMTLMKEGEQDLDWASVIDAVSHSPYSDELLSFWNTHRGSEHDGWDDIIDELSD